MGGIIFLRVRLCFARIFPRTLVDGVLTANIIGLVPSDIPESDNCWDDVTSIGNSAFKTYTSLTKILIIFFYIQKITLHYIK